VLLAATSLIFDPVYPWSLPGYGGPLLAAAVGLVTGLTVLTYLAGRQITFSQFLIVLFLRLAAVALVALLMLRPVWVEERVEVVPSTLLIHLDSSRSMEIKDEFKVQTRWERGLQLLQSPAVKELLDRLEREQQMKVIFYQGDSQTAPLDFAGKPEGKRTNMGYWLWWLNQRHGKEPNLRGLVLLSDGADNDSRYSTWDQASRWGGNKVPITTFALGKQVTKSGQRDIFFVSKKLNMPALVPSKSSFKVNGLVDAPGLANVRVKAQVLFDDQLAKEFPDIVLPNTERDKFRLEVDVDAPAKPGEYKVTLKIVSPPNLNELTADNNTLDSYLTVTKDGISVLWVEGKIRAFEPGEAIKFALTKDPNIRVTYTELLKESKPLTQVEKDWFDLDKKTYDVIVIGDISGSRFAGQHPEVFARIRKLVENGTTGLLMLGGYETFANSDWHNYPAIADILPIKVKDVDPQYAGQLNQRVRVLPTPAGMDHYLLKLADGTQKNKSGRVISNAEVWESIFDKLDGMARLEPVSGTTILAGIEPNPMKSPILVMRLIAGPDTDPESGGRLLAFGGDTTWKAWRRNEAMHPYYERFWQQMIRWLAHQEKLKDKVWVELDTRMILAGEENDLGFSVGFRSPKTHQKIHTGTFTVEIIGPDKKPIPLFPRWDPTQKKTRGYFPDFDQPGEYKLIVKGTGTDEDGTPIDGEAEARFLVHDEDIESQRPAADHQTLQSIAAKSGGQFHEASEENLKAYLEDLLRQSQASNTTRDFLWPDWSRGPDSDRVGDQLSSLGASGMLACYLLFCALICTEWYLRRRWRMV
jgi:hypothetical protein